MHAVSAVTVVSVVAGVVEAVAVMAAVTAANEVASAAKAAAMAGPKAGAKAEAAAANVRSPKKVCAPRTLKPRAATTAAAVAPTATSGGRKAGVKLAAKAATSPEATAAGAHALTASPARQCRWPTVPPRRPCPHRPSSIRNRVRTHRTRSMPMASASRAAAATDVEGVADVTATRSLPTAT